MNVKCQICGSITKISKAHKDYRKLARNPELPYFCEKCSAWLQFQMQNLKGFRKVQ